MHSNNLVISSVIRALYYCVLFSIFYKKQSQDTLMIFMMERNHLAVLCALQLFQKNKLKEALKMLMKGRYLSVVLCLLQQSAHSLLMQ